MSAEKLIRFLVSSFDFGGSSLDGRRIADAPVEADHLGGRIGKGSACFFRQRNDHLKVLDVGYLPDRAGRLSADIALFVAKKGDRARVELFGIEAGAGKYELRLVQRATHRFGELTAA